MSFSESDSFTVHTLTIHNDTLTVSLNTRGFECHIEVSYNLQRFEGKFPYNNAMIAV